jgi:alkylation response protein AidB-like acyl-CoA dehydrogenase
VERIMAANGSSDDQSLSSELVRLRAEARRYRLNAYAAVSSDRPETLTTLGAIHKLTWSTLQVALYELGMRALDGQVELGDAATLPGVKNWTERYWLARASLIYSGANQIQRNIIAERVLGLPKDAVR